MKTGPDALGTAENMYGSGKQENGKPGAQNKKRDLTPLVPPKTSPGTQNVSTGPDTLGTAENESGSAKRDYTPSVPSKTSSGTQNKKTGPDASNTAENESGTQNVKTGPDDLGNAENESGSAKNENRTRRPRYHRKRVRERKTRKRNSTPSVPRKTSLGAHNMKMGPDALSTAENEYGRT
jgi:hypothetical protein